MKKIKTHGYDPLYCYSINELKQMYKHEGLTDREALQRAKKTRKVIEQLNKEEQRSWRDIRENEIRTEKIENISVE